MIDADRDADTDEKPNVPGDEEPDTEGRPDFDTDDIDGAVQELARQLARAEATEGFPVQLAIMRTQLARFLGMKDLPEDDWEEIVEEGLVKGLWCAKKKSSGGRLLGEIWIATRTEGEAGVAAPSAAPAEARVAVLAALPISDIRVGHRRRKLRPEGVARLAASIAAVGLLQPIVVRADGELVAGLHRLEACRSLGWLEIPVTVLEEPELAPDATDRERRLRSRLAEIDENLIREELSALEHAEHMAARKAIYEDLHPETKKGGDKRSEKYLSETVSLRSDAPSFTKDTASALNVSPRSIQQDVQIGTLPEPLRDAIRETELADHKRDLLELSRMEPEAQRTVAAAAAAGELTPEVRDRIFKEERQKRRDKIQQRKTAHNHEIAEVSAASAPAVAGIDLRRCDVVELLEDPTLQRSAELVHADPPWSYDRGDRNGAAEAAYEVLDLGGIVAHVDRAYDLALDGSRLLLWCTFPKLREWFEASRNLRWRYVSGGAWTKEGVGVGDHWRGDAEILLMYVKGSPTRPLGVLSNAHHGARLAHSEKPEAWLRAIVAQLTAPGALVIDLYAGLAPLARASRAEGRRYVGAEIDSDRHALALGGIS